MSLKAKIEAVIYASEEPVTLLQLAGLFGEEAQAELHALAALQTQLTLGGEGEATITAQGGEGEPPQEELAAAVEAIGPEADESVPAAASAVESPMTVEATNDEAAQNAPLPEVPYAAEAAPDDSQPAASATEAEKRRERERERAVREHIRREADALIREYAEGDRGIEIREVAGGYRMGTKPEYHDAVRGFVKSLKPALKLTLQALETLAVVAYKQPVTAAEISEIRGVDSAGVLGGLMARKLIATAGRKQVIGRPMLYKTTREFLVRFGLKDVHELPSMEEFEKLAGELNEQEDLPIEDAGQAGELIERVNARGDREHILQANEALPSSGEMDQPQSGEPSRDNQV